MNHRNLVKNLKLEARHGFLHEPGPVMLRLARPTLNAEAGFHHEGDEVHETWFTEIFLPRITQMAADGPL
jgi:hypothetical protein